ncbi:Sec-independent protein translocase subunit TatA/TatB [Mariniblastus fucicola]|uniref:Sec-independent translocase n=1 Tax=Mariniblastus fucicola TaxID=980251 RepID=A0A5B9P8Y8_9BACT|nr:twin-arginine translocase TatA/TatE family subunit [Mariniblastus fucicola]QEG23207.1 sec-independent translocase [Mariniblastus fucicola]
MLPGGIGTSELVLIAIVAVVLFGSKLPEVARSVGQSYTQFRKGLNDIQTSIKSELDRELEDVKKIPHEIETAYNDSSDDDPGPSYDPPEDI